MKWSAIAVSVLLFGCAGEELHESPPVLRSSEATPRWTVDLNRVRDGIFRTYAPRCLDDVGMGHTVEFRNFMPDVPANVTSIALPRGARALYSPNLVRPYNYVGRNDPANTLCELMGADGACTLRPHFSAWRYTFQLPGVYDWVDTNASTPGRKVTDPYYGTVTFVGIDPSTPFGTLCVKMPDGTGCENVCCVDDGDCGSGTRCFKTDVDATGRCLTPSG